VDKKLATLSINYLQHINNNMSLLDSIVATFAPHDCLGCGAEGSLLCVHCRLLFPQIPARCYRCKKLSSASKTCTSCRSSSQLHTVQALTVYEFIAKDLVWRLKFQGAQAAANEMAALMLPLLAAKEGILLVHLPTATSRIRSRGYDQARLLTRELSRKSGLQFHALLARMGQHHQVGASRERRVTQLADAFRVSNIRKVQGAHIVLIDDVLTTGATLEAAAKTLKAAGAKRIDALVFAQA
jgi:ComF family protein